MLHQHQVTPLLTLRYLQYLCELTQEEYTMKLPRNTLVWCVLIVCLTLLIFTCLTRNRLCEVRLKDGNREVAASLAYESNGK